jgi:4-alpha-glucanotransferase
VLGLGSEARMNTPGASIGNWSWRVCQDQLDPVCADRLRELTETYGRA